MERSVGVGIGVGLSDLALVYPLAVVACRREAGTGLRQAVAAGRLWSGAVTQLSLIPYSILVEAGTQHVRERLQLPPMAAAAVIATVVSAGLQPLEKKLVVDQLLQYKRQAEGRQAARAITNPLAEIARYGRENGVRALYKGFTPLACREFIYIAAISVVNPIAVAASSQWLGDPRRSSLAGTAAAFSVGFSAGMLSAPCQTVNAMMKDERNRSVGLGRILREQVFARGTAAGVHRLFYGAAVRSARCGCAGVLYFGWRTLLEQRATADRNSGSGVSQ